MDFNEVLELISKKYNWDLLNYSLLKSGLINSTFKINTKKGSFILQKVNTNVFKNPFDIDQNIKEINKYLKLHYPNYLFVAPIPCRDDKTLHVINNSFYRVFEFLEHSQTISVVENENQAFAAVKQFGQFTAVLENFPLSKLHFTLPNFHNLTLRYNQYLIALKVGNQDRILQSRNLIKTIEANAFICKKYENFINNKDVSQRVMHHDTKISNVLFDRNYKAICVIDLDTIMPGYFLSDVGDMIRTYTSPANEEESDLEKVVIRKEILKAIQEGYLQNMQGLLTPFEKEHFFFAGEVLIYMQALRFLTDYFNNDIYYNTTYKEQNFIRASNQLKLLEQLQVNI